jgi:SAM-dependent methyltransferase
VGIDFSPVVLDVARQRCGGSSVEFLHGDANTLISAMHPGSIDVFVSVLFTHHLNDPALLEFVASISRACNYGWYIDDLVRSRLGHFLVRILTTLGGFHDIVKHDALVSFERSLTRPEWLRVFWRSQASDVDCRYAWLFRHHFTFRKPLLPRAKAGTAPGSAESSSVAASSSRTTVAE